MIRVPSDVCIDGDILYWAAVPYADGYNIHSGNNYVDTVVGELTTQYQVPEHMQPPYKVSAWVKDVDDKDGHTAKSAAAGAMFEPQGTLVVDERFLNLENWIRQMPYWGPEVVNNDSLHTYTADSVETGDEGLILTATRTGPSSWNSGLISGLVSRSRIYGFFEAEIDFTRSSGLWPAFWLLNKNYNSQYFTGIEPEIDILEYVNGLAYQTYHAVKPRHNVWSSSVEIPDGFNKFGVLWEPRKITWFVNRRPVFSIYGDQVASQEMYPILNLAVGGNWPKDPPASLQTAWMKVKSYRVWQ